MYKIRTNQEQLANRVVRASEFLGIHTTWILHGKRKLQIYKSHTTPIFVILALGQEGTMGFILVLLGFYFLN
jgi:hypothetical protein